MANFSVTGVVLTFTVLFFTFPLCYGRLRPTSLPENVINIGTDFPISLLNSEVNPMIRFPIDVTESQLAEMIGEKETGSIVITEMLPANETGNNDLPKMPESETGADSELVVKQSESETGATTELVKKLPELEVVPRSEQLPEMETVTVKSMPLRLARYRPVIRPCHHNHHRHHHLFPQGGNMIVPTGENGDFNRVIIHNQLHRIPPRWSSIPYLHHHHHHHHHDDSNNEESNSMFKRSARFNKEKFNKHFHHHHDHEDHEQHERKSFNRKMKNQKLDSTKTKETGLFNRIRKMMITF